MTSGVDGLRLRERSDVPPAADTLAAAFHNYPLLVYYYPDEVARQKVATQFMAFGLYVGIKYGEVYMTPRTEGVAIWMPPASYPLTFGRILRSVPLSVLLGFARHGGARMRPFNRHLDSVHRRLVRFEHWYLGALGVAPQFWGRGHAGKLMWPMLTRLDRERQTCYLETGDEKNVPMYEHFGFRTIDKSVVPGTTLVNWAMLREPAPSHH